MTLKELAQKDGDVLLAEDVAEYLHVSPQLIREQARTKPELLGFRVIVIGTRTLIPKAPFIDFIRGPRTLIQIQDLKEENDEWQSKSPESFLSPSHLSVCSCSR